MKNKIKILHYVDENILSWARPYVQILEELRNLGAENIIVCRPGGTLSDMLKNSGFEVHEYKPLISSLAFFDLGFHKILKSVKPDLIHTRLSSAANIGGYWGKKLNIPVLAAVDKFPKKKYYKNVTKILPCSTPVADFMASQGISREKMTVLFNAVDVDFYAKNISMRNEFRKRENLNEKNICFLGMGRFVDWKGFDDLIKAFAEFLKNQNNNEKFFLWLAGDGPERGKLESLAKELNIDKQIKFFGFVNDVRNLLWASDVYIHPSWGDEAFGLSLLEAMSAGLPVIASESGGMTEILNNSQGLLFPRRNIKKLSEQMNEALKKADVLSAASLLRAKDFDVKIIAEKTLDIYFLILT